MMIKDFKTRFLVSLVITVPILLLSPTIQDWFNFSVPNFGANSLVLAVLASGLVVYGGLPFYKGARTSLKSQVLDMNVLVSLAVLSGYLYSLGATFIFTAPDFFWEISTLVLFLLFGHWMEMRAVKGAAGALKELVKLIPLKANLVKGKDVIEINTSDITKGNVLLIKPGEKIPIDGIVIDGNTSVNESMITGESKPVTKQKGDEVIGGTINQTGAIRIKVEKTGEETAIAQIIELVKTAQASKPRTQKLADRAAHYLTLTAVIVGTLTFIYWFGIANAGLVFALTLAITVLVIACPHALGLAIPTVTSISTTLAAKNGILVKDMNAMEIAKNIDYIVFDKTGTLTKGTFEVSDIITLSDWNKKTLLGKAAALEINSEHVIGKGIIAKAKEDKLRQPKTRNFKAIPGKGAKAVIGKKETYIGNGALMNYLKLDTTLAKKQVKKLASQGKTTVYIATKKEIKGIIALSDILRKESFQAVKEIKNAGVKVAMLTGDNALTAKYVAEELGLDTYFAEVLPGDKTSKIKELQSKGNKVAMVGDGVNDAPALTQADIGIAIGAGTDVAVESAEIVLVKNDPRDISRLVTLSKATMRKMKENLIWATGYNAIAIPTAAGVLLPYGILLRPEYAALIMAASSIIVVTNALMLRNLKLTRGD
ncbi:MAG: heavy metal translocating P-type ATPase [Candidatus Diapherotrites archaeon]|nr:heavy metal translocating P-type ATPase [Candidatus Diapherotrites archaeon]